MAHRRCHRWPTLVDGEAWLRHLEVMKVNMPFSITRAG